jgi:hypothetical protein
MNGNVKYAVVLALFVAVAGGVVFYARQDPSGHAAGGSARADALWARLQDYRGTYLRRWMSAYGGQAPTAKQVLEAFDELGYQVTGPGGFWRKDVRQGWLGCDRVPDQSSCEQLSAAEGEFGRWDAFLEQAGNVSEKQAAQFIDQHFNQMSEYLDTYAPVDPSATGMQKTGFFEKNLRGTLDSNGAL